MTTQRPATRDARRALRQHDPDAVDGRRPEGQLGPPGHADGAGADHLRALHAGHEPQPRGPGLARPRPLRALRRATRRCSSTRCSTSAGYGLDARRPQELPPARQPHRRPPRVRRTPRASRPPPARSARASPTRVGLALAERMLAARFNRPGHEIVDHYTYTIASDGDMQEGMSAEAALARRPPRPRPADRLLRRQPHLDRGRHRALVLRGRGQALRGLRLARPEPGRGPRAGPDRAGDRRGQGASRTARR